MFSYLIALIILFELLTYFEFDYWKLLWHLWLMMRYHYMPPKGKQGRPPVQQCVLVRSLLIIDGNLCM